MCSRPRSPMSPALVGEPCGQHGNYTFYKAFKYQLKGDDRIKVLMLGEFFFLRISPHDDPCIGELQLLWDDRNSDQLLSSTRLYFLPEQTPDGRLSSHGEVSRSLTCLLLSTEELSSDCANARLMHAFSAQSIIKLALTRSRTGRQAYRC